MAGYIGSVPVPQSTQTRDNFTATSGQTTFSTSGYTPNYLDVYLNGVHLDPSDYTATNGTDVVLGTGATAGDVLEVVAFTTFTTTSDIDNNSTTTGTLTVDGGDVTFYEDTGTTAKFFWDASAESLGIGTSSPISQLSVVGANSGFEVNGDSGSSNARLLAYDRNASAYRQMDFNASQHTFQTSNAERMRIDSSGNIIQSATGAYSNSADTLQINVPSQAGILMGTNTTTNVYRMRYYVGGAKVGQITTSGSTTTYTTSSDYRLKTDVQPMTGATERLKALKPVNFEWISTGTRVDGFLAHEAQEVVPEAVTGTKDAMTTEEYEVTPAVLDDDGNVVTEAVMGTREVPDYQGIDQSKLVPLLVATIQELEARIAALENA